MIFSRKNGRRIGPDWYYAKKTHCVPRRMAAPPAREIHAAMAFKLAVTVDLHAPITKHERLEALAGEMAAFEPDAAVLAGDIAESLGELEHCLKLFKDRLPCPVWVLAGNHDLWVRRSSDSKGVWLERFPRAVKAAGCHYLEGISFTLGSTAVIGTIAWYDYSSADPSVQASAVTFAQEKFNYNNDALLIDWEWSDPEFAAMVAGPFLGTLERLQSDPAIRHIVVITHVPILEQQIQRNPEDKSWAFTNAYFGNLTLGRQVLAHGKVTHVLSGHTHLGKQALVERPGLPAIDARVLPSDYHEPAWVGLKLE
jgi:3',5'-cyclic AMP phosphodiesterase CpdA